MDNIISPDYILINGISSNTVGLYIDTPPVPPMAHQRYTQYQVGADTDIVSSDDSFENIKITVNAFQFFPENFDNRTIYEFLKDAQTLQTSRFHNFLYRIQKLTVQNPESSHNGKKIRYRIDFECEPFKYAVENPMEDISQGSITNFGDRYSRPVWTVTGNGGGDCILTVNGEEFKIFNNLNEAACLDGERMMVYTNSQIITQHTSGNLPFLAVGENSVSWNENVSRVTLQKNERWY